MELLGQRTLATILILNGFPPPPPQRNVAFIYPFNPFDSGWAYLSIETNGLYYDELQAAGAGYLEGQITADMIWFAYPKVI